MKSGKRLDVFIPLFLPVKLVLCILVQERRHRKGVIVTLNAVIDFLLYIEESMQNPSFRPPKSLAQFYVAKKTRNFGNFFSFWPIT